MDNKALEPSSPACRTGRDFPIIIESTHYESGGGKFCFSTFEIYHK